MSKIKVGDRVIRTRSPEEFNYSYREIEYKGRYTVQEIHADFIRLKELPKGQNLYGIEYFEKVDDGITQISENYNI